MLELKNIRSSSGTYSDTRTAPVKDKRRKEYATETIDHELTAWGVYNIVLLSIQNDRHWADSTCVQYDRAFSAYVAPIFDGLAYNTLTLEDFSELWDAHSHLFKSASAEERANVIFCCFIAEAAKQGYSDTDLWGMGVMDEIAKTADDDYHLSDEALGKKLGHQRLTAKFLPLETELALYDMCVAMSETNGACVAILLMLMLGYRTSEATGLSFGDMRKMDDDLYALELRRTTKHSSRELQDSVKTANGYRLLPLTPKFYDFLKKRRQKAIAYLAKSGAIDPEHKVKELPLACVGTVYDRRCMDKEINGIFKVLCEKVGVKEVLFETAVTDLREDPKLRSEHDGSPVVYLMRHQAATEFAMTNASRDAISALMGHVQDDPSALTADYASADGQRKLLHILEQRPLYLAINGAIKIPQTTLSSGKKQHYFDGSTDIKISQDGQLKVFLQATEANSMLNVKIEGEHLIRSCDTFLTPSASEPSYSISTVEHLRDYTAAAIRGEADSKWTPVCSDPATLVAIPALDDLRRDWTPEVSGKFTSSLKHSAPDKDSYSQYVTCNNATLLATLTDGTLIALPSEYPCKTKPLTGDKLLDTQIRKIAFSHVVVFQHDIDKIVMSSDGAVWFIPASVSVDDFLQADDWRGCRIALASGGCIANCTESADSLLCVSQDGRLERFPLDLIISKKLCGQQFIRNFESKIVSICCCGEHDDVLIASIKGQALRLCVADITMRKALSSTLHAGMRLRDGDAVCCCTVYHAERNLVAISRRGSLLHISTKSEITTHGRGSQGVRLMRLTDDRLACVAYAPDAILMVTSGCYAHCRSITEVTPVACGTQGRIGIKLRRDNQIIGAIPLHFKRYTD